MARHVKTFLFHVGHVFEFNYINLSCQFSMLNIIPKELTLCSSNTHTNHRKSSSILEKFGNYIPYPIRFPHRNTENDVPFSHLQISAQPFFDFLCHRVRSQSLHFDQTRRNSTKEATQQPYT